jgi:hypothetical protein
MAMDFLSPPTRVKSLEQAGESAMKASIAKGMPHGYEVGYGSFTINGRMLDHGEPIRVKQGERVLTSRLGYWKIPLMDDSGDITGAHSSNSGNGKLTEPTGE